MKNNKLYSIENLKDYVGDNEADIKEMISIFVETTPKDVNKFISLLSTKNYSEIYKIAHKVKASFKVFKIETLITDIKNIEDNAINNNKDNSLPTLIDSFMINFNFVIDEMKSDIN